MCYHSTCILQPYIYIYINTHTFISLLLSYLCRTLYIAIINYNRTMHRTFPICLFGHCILFYFVCYGHSLYIVKLLCIMQSQYHVIILRCIITVAYSIMFLYFVCCNSTLHNTIISHILESYIIYYSTLHLFSSHLAYC